MQQTISYTPLCIFCIFHSSDVGNSAPVFHCSFANSYLPLCISICFTVHYNCLFVFLFFFNCLIIKIYLTFNICCVDYIYSKLFNLECNGTNVTWSYTGSFTLFAKKGKISQIDVKYLSSHVLVVISFDEKRIVWKSCCTFTNWNYCKKERYLLELTKNQSWKKLW